MLQAPDREHVLGLLAQLEALNPLAEPTQNLSRVAGDWRLLFSTITILVSLETLGSKVPRLAD